MHLDDTPRLTIQEEAELRARDDKRRREEDERKRRADEDRKAEEKRQKEEKLRRLEEERRRLQQEEEWKRLGSDKILPYPPAPSSFLDDNNSIAMKSWYLDDEVSKPTLRMASLKPGRRSEAPRVTLSQLKELGVVYYRINLSDFMTVNCIVKERFYKHTDEIRVSQTNKDEQLLEKLFAEHFNEDEQLRLVTDGSCYVDVRSKSDTWIRMQLTAGDLIVLPAGMFHRSTLDESDYCATMRVFRDAQRWAPVFRSEKRAESHPVRLLYARMAKGKSSVAAELGFK